MRIMVGKVRPRRRDAAWNPPSSSGDVTALFAMLVAVPLLLPLLSGLAVLLFALPVIVMAVAAPRCLAAARRSPHPLLWRVYALAAVFGAITAALATASVLDSRLATVAFYFGAGASACFLAGLLPLVRRDLLTATERLVDAMLFDAVVVALGVWFVAVPGFDHGDPVLTAVFVVDLVALALAAVPTLAATARDDRRTGWWLLGVCAGATFGDGFVAAGGTSVAFTALAWTAASVALVGAATCGARTHSGARGDDPEEEHGAFVIARIVLPPLGMLAFPVAAAVLGARDELSTNAALYFSIFFVTTLMLAFGRQGYLLLDNRRAVTRERRLRKEMVRRNEELEALTALAATLTETLEEDPVIERGLAALRLAGRASSMALHLPASDESGLVLQAAAGDWATDSPWVTRDAPYNWRPGIETAGGRQMIRLAVSARGHYIGLVTLVRRDDDPVTDAEMRVLRLLADQVAIGVQNARDYRDRLEQAIRDPLTGLLNRRYLYEAFSAELDRSARYGSSGSIVMIDVDDFKQVNDTLGHTAGDNVLCEIGQIALGKIRGADSFARVGGEEFALILPETSQLDALIVAERVRRAVAAASILPDRTVTVSAGIATWPEDGSVLEELERKADAALYWAKRNGKNLCAVATEVVVPEAGDSRDGMLAHLHALVATIDSQHLNTRDHSQNVAAYAAAIGEHVGLSRERIVLLRRAALFHDIGKVAVRGEVLNKPSALTAAEFEEIKVHAVVGGAMLKHSGFELEADWVRHHHERLDGRGYPDGLAGREVPIEARIIHVADSFEAMTSDRPYHAGIAVPDAVAELRRCAGTQFDARMVEALVELLELDKLSVLALRDSA
jgi:diguanylate cyclase (GGDEF)-like protein/putative nucleotidyltransferase with HDIG domain